MFGLISRCVCSPIFFFSFSPKTSLFLPHVMPVCSTFSPLQPSGELEEEMENPEMVNLPEKQKHQLRHRELFLSRQLESLPATHIRYAYASCPEVCFPPHLHPMVLRLSLKASVAPLLDPFLLMSKQPVHFHERLLTFLHSALVSRRFQLSGRLCGSGTDCGIFLQGEVLRDAAERD